MISEGMFYFRAAPEVLLGQPVSSYIYCDNRFIPYGVAVG